MCVSCVSCAVVCRVECVHVEWRGLGLLIEVEGFMDAFLVRLKTTAPTEFARQIVAGAHGKGGQLVSGAWCVSESDTESRFNLRIGGMGDELPWAWAGTSS